MRFYHFFHIHCCLTQKFLRIHFYSSRLGLHGTFLIDYRIFVTMKTFRQKLVERAEFLLSRSAG
jgi:hypothetical protein